MSESPVVPETVGDESSPSNGKSNRNAISNGKVLADQQDEVEASSVTNGMSIGNPSVQQQVDAKVSSSSSGASDKTSSVLHQVGQDRISSRQQIVVEETRDRHKIEWLDLSKYKIEEKETKILARDLESNKLKNLKVLFLHGNEGDLGFRAMLNALRAGYLERVQELYLWEVSSYDQITAAEEGTDAIADALADRKMPNLKTLDLTGSLPKLLPPRSLLETVRDLMKCDCGRGRLWECCRCLSCTETHEGADRTLRFLCQFGRLDIYSGDDGIRKIAKAIEEGKIKSLKFLNLQHNYIKDKGARELARILRHGVLPNLEELDLQNNPVGSAGAWKLVFAFLINPLLTVRVLLDWPKVVIQERAIAFRDGNIRLEHMLEDMNISRDDVVPRNTLAVIYPGFHLKRPKSGRRNKDNNHRLHIHCQADYESFDKSVNLVNSVNSTNNFQNHCVQIQTDDGLFKEPDGIEIRKQLPCCATSKATVERDLEESPSSDEDTPTFEERARGRAPDDSITGEERGPEYSSDESHPGTHRLNRTPTESFKRTKGVNRIHVTADSCGFIGAAKTVSLPSTRIRKWYAPVQKLFENPKKTKRRLNFILEELLMLAERKPEEFYHLFGLRQVLLKNPEKKSKYSRVWICQLCFDKYKRRGGDHVRPIVRDAELEPRHHEKVYKP